MAHSFLRTPGHVAAPLPCPAFIMLIQSLLTVRAPALTLNGAVITPDSYPVIDGKVPLNSALSDTVPELSKGQSLWWQGEGMALRIHTEHGGCFFCKPEVFTSGILQQQTAVPVPSACKL